MKNDDFNIADYMSRDELEEEQFRLNTQWQIEEDERREREYLEQVEKDNEEYYKSLMEYEFNPDTISRGELLHFINSEILQALLEQYSGDEKEMIIQKLIARANDLNIGSVFKSKLRQVARELEGNVLCLDTSDNAEFVAVLDNKLTRTSNGNIENTVDNFYNIMVHDTNISGHVKYNEISEQIEYWENGISREWREWDDASLIAYIETNYGLYNQSKFLSAFNKVVKELSYNPVKRFIEFQEWDGVPRIDNFLKDICKCKNNEEYLREVSRMIFYGGIHRIYDPGCKFDYMPILVGKQGNGKSSIVKWLNINSEFYREVLSIDGKDSVENLSGGWICEFSELQGMVRASDLETLKGFITREVDNYRPAYGRYMISRPRHCVFIGTTNDIAFLTDKTGNRRYLPVRVGLDKGELYGDGNLEYVKEYILQCWREAKYLMEQGETYLSIPKEYDKYIEEAQSAAVVEDPRVGLVDKYLRSKKVEDKVCGIEVFVECFNGISDKMNISQSKEISRIMKMFENWERVDNPTNFDKYGRQKYWKKVQEDID